MQDCIPSGMLDGMTFPRGKGCGARADDGKRMTDKAAQNGPGGGYTTLRLCVNFRAGDMLPSCGARGSRDLRAALEEKMPERLPDMTLQTVHCLGRCHLGPTIRLSPAGPFLLGVQAADADRLLDLLAAGDIETARREFPDPNADEAAPEPAGAAGQGR